MPRGKKVVTLDKAPEVVVPETPSIVDEIVWFSKRSCQTSKQDYKDVGITLSHHNKNGARKNDYYSITFSFRNHISNVFGKGNIYLQFGVVKNRIYFKVADPKIGYKLTAKHGLTSYMQVTCSKEMKAIYEEFCPGEYHLRYDEFQELHYIEKEK